MQNRGLFYGIAAYLMWGFFPLYWHALDHISAGEILIHRIVWSFVFLIILLTIRKNWGWIKGVIKAPKTLLFLFLAATLLSINWFIYIWGVNSGFVVETSLGYFINPLVNVLFGVIFFKEKIRIGQWLAIGFATIGVLYLTFGYGSFPWIALSLAVSFGFYGVLKKLTSLQAVESLSIEMSVLVIPAILAWYVMYTRGAAQFLVSDSTTIILLVLGGVVTIVPLIFFSAAAQLVPLSMLGILQYIAPTFQFLIGVFIFSEPFNPERLVGFVLIWIALLLYSLEGYYQRRSQMLVNT